MKTKESDSGSKQNKNTLALPLPAPTHTHESTRLTQAGMKGVTKGFVAVRRADQFRQECGTGDSDEERSGQHEAEESGVDLFAFSTEGEQTEEQRINKIYKMQSLSKKVQIIIFMLVVY